jgi:transposase
MSVSADTIIQRIRQIQLPTPPVPKVIGVDDWAKHKGQSYGTIVVDLEGHINRLKTLKRAMYGRAKFDLLRIRVLAGSKRGAGLRQ